MNKLLTVLGFLALAIPAAAQGQNTTPPSQTLGSFNDRGGQSRPLMGVVTMNPDGTLATGGGGGGSTPTGPAGSPNSSVVSVQGVAGGFPQTMVGNVAAGSTDAGNSVKVGCVFNTANLIVTTGQRADLNCTQRGELMATPSFAGTVSGVGNDGNDAISGVGTANKQQVISRGTVYNGTAWDRQRGDVNGTWTVPQATATAGAGTTVAASTAAEGSRVLKAAPGNLYGLNVATGATAGVIQVFNSTTVPADGTVSPSKCFYLAASSSFDLNLRAAPTYMSTGITVVFSSGTSCFTKAASATAFISGDFK